MKVTLTEVKDKCKRKNAEANNRLHWFASNFSIYFSYIFIRMGLSADLVTIIFFISGLIGSVFYLFDSIIFSLIGYFFFRLHIIIDMSDGDVARFNKSFSIRGSYWDSMIHSILNPLYHLSISFSYYLVFDNIIFLIIAPFLVLSSSLLMAVKNNYFKALLFNNKTENKKSSKKMSRLKYIFY